MDDTRFDEAWRKLIAEDASITAPPHIRDAVMQRWDTSVEGQATGGRRSRHVAVGIALGAAAAAVVVAAIAVSPRTDGTQTRGPRPDTRAVVTLPAPPPANGESVQVAIKAPPRTQRRRAHSATAPVAAAPDNGAIVQLTADRAFDSESLMLVRVRVPRTSLQAFGVALLEPEVSALVDVDVVVGEDGLPREIRRIRPVMHVEP